LARQGDNAVSNADVSRFLDAFEDALEDLRISYEKYFLGVERQAPANKHRRVKAEMRRIEEIRPRSTALRFRFNGLRARLVTYQHYWNRILGQIEKGTYRRDIQQRVQRRQPVEPPAPAPPTPSVQPEPDAPQPGMSTDLSAPSSSARPPGPPRPPGSGRPPPPPPPPVVVPGMKGGDVQRLFRDLVTAKQQAGEDIKGLTVRALARKLSRELPKLQQRHGARVRFEVATVGGKVRLRARSTNDAD